mmetsp:Transcript_22517/g.72801  ORF Transcript_22517/g.72801 Transcript_22517/m.72801 type:complete len:248 (-) Transcript_22517:2748-3491(-)
MIRVANNRAPSGCTYSPDLSAADCDLVRRSSETGAYDPASLCRPRLSASRRFVSASASTCERVGSSGPKPLPAAADHPGGLCSVDPMDTRLEGNRPPPSDMRKYFRSMKSDSSGGGDGRGGNCGASLLTGEPIPSLGTGSGGGEIVAEDRCTEDLSARSSCALSWQTVLLLSTASDSACASRPSASRRAPQKIALYTCLSCTSASVDWRVLWENSLRACCRQASASRSSDPFWRSCARKVLSTSAWP